MMDNTKILHNNNNSDYMASGLLAHLSDFEFQECKPEPCISRTNSTEDLSTRESSEHITQPAIKIIRNPRIVLERCDKIWQTLQLIKNVQIDEPTLESDETKSRKEEEKEEEKVQQLNEVKLFVSDIENESTSRHNDIISLPFEFSVKKTKKLYPCITCGKQYMERRSLRKHAHRVHGIIIPLQRNPKTKKSIDKKNTNPIVLSNKKDNSEKLEKDPLEKIVAVAKSINTEEANECTSKYMKCILCQRNVKYLKEHLITYHKIGDSSNIIKLESSLLNEDKQSSSKAPGTKKPTLKDILSGKPPQKSANENTQDESHLMDHENVDRESQINGKRKDTSSHVNQNKKLKLNNENYVHKRIVPRKTSINLISYKCDICLGTYASAHGLYKHKRVHFKRGETKENFHNFKCRYLNSPLNEKRLLNSALNNLARNASNNINKNLRLNNSENKESTNASRIMNQVDRCNKKKMNENKPICLCGKTFRHFHTLYIHKKTCKSYRQKDKTIKPILKLDKGDKDSGNGLNITIKKRNDGYEIVGKDSDEEKSQKSIHFKDDTSSSSDTLEDLKSKSNTITEQQEASKYSKNHSILKLEIVDEDEIINIEDDLQTDLKINNQSDVQEDNTVTERSLVQQSSNMESNTVPHKVLTLKQMCQKVLNGLQKRTSTNAAEKVQECNQIKKRKIDEENIQVVGQDTNYKIKRELRTSNKRQKNINKEFDYSYGEIYVSNLDSLLVCGYCNEQFGTSNSYNNHQCTIQEGKSFDEFSLGLMCFYCNKTLKDYNQFDKHVQSEHLDNMFNCYQCPERFVNDKIRLRHLHMEHNYMHCRFCGKKLSVTVKVLHEGYHLGFGYPCHKCKKAYTNKKNLMYHQYATHPQGGDELVTCTLCFKSIKLKSFRYHMITHKHNTCHFCNKVFSSKTDIKYHTMRHHGTKSKCNVCGTRFISKKYLEKHEKSGCNSAMKTNKHTTVHVKNR